LRGSIACEMSDEKHLLTAARPPLRSIAAEQKINLALRRVESVLEKEPDHVGSGHVEPRILELGHALLDPFHQWFG
jgi:hypothetical protein